MPPVLSKRKRKYNEQDLLEAIAAVKNGAKFRDASAQFGIPIATLADKIKGKYHEGKSKPGDKNTPNVPPKSLHLHDGMSNREQISDLSRVNHHLIGHKYFPGGNPSSETLQDRGCSTAPGSPCEHYIELIVEKARNHRLRKANEGLELQVEELVHRMQEQTSSSPPLVQDMFAGHFVDVKIEEIDVKKEEMDVEVKEEEELG